MKRSKRNRYREILSNPRLRDKFTSKRAHFSDFDPKYRLSIPSDKLWVDNNILERNGIYVKKIRTERPGYVIYEDEWQLVAEPFRKGTMPRR